MSENSGTDARFPYEHRQNVVVRLCMFLLSEQERAVKIFYLNINITLDEREVGVANDRADFLLE